jgi:hypothetical protein
VTARLLFHGTSSKPLRQIFPLQDGIMEQSCKCFAAFASPEILRKSLFAPLGNSFPSWIRLRQGRPDLAVPRPNNATRWLATQQVSLGSSGSISRIGHDLESGRRFEL